ncbi:hypothetical protein [Thermococcus sp. Bubb.Bath]|uniref:hypothetical protein n=1 Tax=Thermococcus sp. Bubb.Bath TaxID=1638242 RepID=UPI00143AE139|nr:hypothetical protein [Thermococcus sp. Bubb.Bath]NJF25164.1 hypothetical protein [Thermococcus sp. Bubb.Bath]
MLSLDEVEEVLEKTKLKLLIQENARFADAKVFDLTILAKDGHIAAFFIADKKPKRAQLPNLSKLGLRSYVLWKEKDKIYAQEIGDNDVIPLEIYELDAFIDLVLM